MWRSASALLFIAATVTGAVGHGPRAQAFAQEKPASSGSDTRSRFVGTWRLASIESRTPAGETQTTHPVGLIYYDATGHMAVQIMPTDRAKYAGTVPTPDEAKAALTGYTAYFGSYSIDEGKHTVAHHREGNLNPSSVGIAAVRRYEFAGDRLILTPVENPTTHLTWERTRSGAGALPLLESNHQWQRIVLDILPD